MANLRDVNHTDTAEVAPQFASVLDKSSRIAPRTADY